MVYEKTHKWLTFSANFQGASPSFWATLGECQSKCEHIAGVPLRPDVNEILHRVYLAKGVWGTTAIEGNTLSEQEVLRQIEGKLEVPPSKEYLRREVENIIRESNRMLDEIRHEKLPVLSLERVKEINLNVLSGLTLDEGVVPGEIRTYPVGVMRYRGAPANECEHLLTRLCAWINGNDFEPQSGFNVIHMAILKAIIAHLYLEWIHPFGDGNGRTGRMVEVQLLLSAGIPSPAAHLLSNHYNLTREDYLRHLDEASHSGGDILPFIQYALNGFLTGLKEQLAYIRKLQMEVAWINYIHDYFRHDGSRSAQKERQKRIMLAILGRENFSSLGEIPGMSPELAIAYSAKHPRTMIRDVEALVEQRLLIRQGKRVKANEAIMSAYLPIKAHRD